jgi:serine/threonine-protein kinase MRCK
VRIPKPGGVKKGWTYQYVVVCDFKLFLYDCMIEKSGKPTEVNQSVNTVLDMRDEMFSVTSVQESDVIHAPRREIPCIFRVTTSQIDNPATGSSTISSADGVSPQADIRKSYTLIMTDNPNEKSKWVIALNELQKLLRKSKLPDKKAYVVKELVDQPSLPLIKSASCAAVIDKDRLAIAGEDGLFCVELNKETVMKVGEGKKIEAVQFVHDEQLLIVMGGKQRVFFTRCHENTVPLGKNTSRHDKAK